MKRELPFGFEKILSENRESAVRAVNDDEGAFLSSLYLSEGKIIEPSYLTAMTERGMAEEDKEGRVPGSEIMTGMKPAFVCNETQV